MSNIIVGREQSVESLFNDVYRKLTNRDFDLNNGQEIALRALNVEVLCAMEGVKAFRRLISTAPSAEEQYVDEGTGVRHATIKISYFGKPWVSFYFEMDYNKSKYVAKTSLHLKDDKQTLNVQLPESSDIVNWFSSATKGLADADTLEETADVEYEAKKELNVAMREFAIWFSGIDSIRTSDILYVKYRVDGEAIKENVFDDIFQPGTRELLQRISKMLFEVDQVAAISSYKEIISQLIDKTNMREMQALPCVMVLNNIIKDYESKIASK